MYWDNPARRVGQRFIDDSAQNKLTSIEISRTADGLSGVVRTTHIDAGTPLNRQACSTLKATTQPGPPVIAGGSPTLSGTLDLDCRVAGSHLTASVRFSGCEY